MIKSFYFILFQIVPQRLCTSETSSSSLKPEVIEKIIKNNEVVAYYGRDSFERKIKTFLNAGFTKDNSIKIIDKYPNILRLSTKQIGDRLEMWHFAKFSQTQYFELFVQCPELLELDDEHRISKRYTQLQEIVVTPKNIWRLLMSCPNVMVDDIESIRGKVDYILTKMEADETDLVKSGSLGLSLQQIKSRHTILVRLGIFKKRNRKASVLDPNKNPRLFRIMDSSDAEFASKTCGISMKELEAFYELYERELDEKLQEELDYAENSDGEYDDEIDNDDESFDPRQSADYYDDRNKLRYKKSGSKKQNKPN